MERHGSKIALRSKASMPCSPKIAGDVIMALFDVLVMA